MDARVQAAIPPTSQPVKNRRRISSLDAASGACPGYIKDNVVPLACGGPDSVANLQWQTIDEAKAKDAWERKGCRR